MNVARTVSSRLSRDQNSSSFRLVERAMWVAVVAFYLVGDTATTIVSLEVGALERNGIAQLFLDSFGYPGLVLHKLAILTVILSIWFVITYAGNALDTNPRPFCALTLGMFALQGAVLTASNIQVAYSLLSPIA